jgi:aminotransferase
VNYDRIIAENARKLQPSGIRRFFDIAESMDNVISLSVGEPDFKTPWQVRKSAITELEKGRTRYTSNAGMQTLRDEISAYLSRFIHVDYDPKKEIVVTVGGSEAIDLAIRALVNPGDEVLICEPSFVCYAPITALVGGVPVALVTRAEDCFKLTADTLRAAITPKTKLLILPFPNNPTGAVMRKADLEAIADVLSGTEIMVLSDEIYGELTYGDIKHISLASLPGMRERTIVVNGFSKTYAMTGWRLGYAAGPQPIISQMMKIHQYAVMCAPTTSQYAAITALTRCDEDVAYMCGEYDLRRRLCVKMFNDMGLTCFEPEGAFYVFPSVESTGLSSQAFCEKLIREQRVACVPGNAFGQSGEGFIRVCYAYSVKNLLEAMGRIREFLNHL